MNRNELFFRSATWMQQTVDSTTGGEELKPFKSILLRAFTDDDVARRGIQAQTIEATTLVENVLMPLARLVAADHRELWEILDEPHRVVCRLQTRRISLWNEQQAFKKVIQCIEFLQQQHRTDGVKEDDEVKDDVIVLQSVLDTIHARMSATLKPHRGESSLSADVLPPNHYQQQRRRLEGVTSATIANVFVVDMQYCEAATDDDDDDEEEAAAAPPVVTSSEPTTPPDDETSNEGRCVSSSAPSAAPLHVAGEGSLHCNRELPPMSRLIEVPRELMFCIPTLLACSERTATSTFATRGRRCYLFDAILSCGPSARSHSFPDDETLLLLCFVFEMFFVGPDRSAWRQLLLGQPKCYPSVPTSWSLTELGELEGNTMIDDVLEKKEQLMMFQAQAVAAFEALDIANKVEKAIRSDAKEGEDVSASWPVFRIADVFSMEHLHWARSTFDSRAFQLNIDGTVTMALVPFADMINHGVLSDVIMRHVDPNGGPFVLTTGAELTDGDIGRELMMSYGPLQSWELVMSYGFILPDDDDGNAINDNDRIPFPIGIASSSSSLADDNVGDDDEAARLELEYQPRRLKLIQDHGLLLGSGASQNQFWIGHHGVPCPALLALIRLQLAEVEHYPALEARPMAVFDSTIDPILEARVVETVRAAVEAMLEDFSTTIDEDVRLLQLGREMEKYNNKATAATSSAIPSSVDIAVDTEEAEIGHSLPDADAETEHDETLQDEEEEEADEEWTPSAPSKNAMIAIQLRLNLKRMLHRVISWCDQQV